ncbi:MAG: hypothetical protein LH606_01305 [Cytophagaceae bacterium]|nr:hypothetical protein [Cytophagaceae bacterium]
MMPTKRSRILVLLLTAAVAVTSCKKNEEEPVEPNELITTVTLTFTEVGMTTSRTVTWKDADGDGGAAPTVGKLSLSPNKTYALSVAILDESKSPASNVGEEVAAEKDEHLIVYTPTPANLLTVTITDKDSRTLPVVLSATAVTTAAGTGKLQVVLRHQPPVGGKDVKDGTPGPGSTDFDGTFEVEIK